MLFEVLAKVRKEGLMSIENDVESPHESPIFGKNPALSSNHDVTEFITDYLGMMFSGNLNALRSRLGFITMRQRFRDTSWLKWRTRRQRLVSSLP